LLTGSGYFLASWYAQQNPSENNGIGASSRVISADGRLEPKGEIVLLAAPYSMERARVQELRVKRGDWVQSGSIIAVLDSYDIMKTALDEAIAREQAAFARLQQVKAGAKVGEIAAQGAKVFEAKSELNGQIAAQQARIRSLNAQLIGEKNAQLATIERIQAEFRKMGRECDRYISLHRSGAVTTSQMESECLSKETAQKRLQEAQATLTRIIDSRRQEIKEAEATLERTVSTVSQQIKEVEATYDATEEVRPVDIAVAEAELKASKAAVQQSQNQFNLTLVRSPSSGKILEIHALPGELVTQGIADIGYTKDMFAVAEVYETDISDIVLGQNAEIQSPALAQPIYGKVSEIGLEVDKKDILNDDPVVAADARVVKVRILLDKSSNPIASKLTNLKVDVFIKR
jgi:HlyD family secretion protein